MKIFSSITREFALMALPCALFLGITLLNSNESRNQPNIDYATPVLAPTPTPAGFYATISKFQVEPVTPQQAAKGADTSLKIETRMGNVPKNVRWYYARRLVAHKNGRWRVLWNDKEKSSSLLLSSYNLRSEESREDTLLWKLRDVPSAAGELVFVWDALAQPVNHNLDMSNDKLVNIATLNRAAKSGGARLSRRLILRSDGQIISTANFLDSKPLSVSEGKIFLMDKADDTGSDVQIELYLNYQGTQSKPEITVESVALADTSGRAVDIVSYQDGAIREGAHWVWRGTTKRTNLHGAKRLRIFIVATDGKSKLQNLSAMATLDTNIVN